MRPTLISGRVFAALCALVCSCMLLAACAAPAPDPTRDPVSSVEALLGLRYDRSTDASAYARLLVDPELAKSLANASREESSSTPPTPRWEQPYLSGETTSTAEVVVLWKTSKDLPGYPTASVFMMQKVDGAWKAKDARSIEGTQGVPPAMD